jgi:hypothetical protein
MRARSRPESYSGSSSESAASPPPLPGFEFVFDAIAVAFFPFDMLDAEAAGAPREQFPQAAGFAGAVAADPPTLRPGTACPATRYFLIFSSLFGPIPRTDNKSSTFLNAPYDFLIARIFSAVAGPIPGTSCSCAELAELMSTGWVGGFFVAAIAGTNRKAQLNNQANTIRGGMRTIIAVRILHQLFN